MSKSYVEELLDLKYFVNEKIFRKIKGKKMCNLERLYWFNGEKKIKYPRNG